VSEFNRQAAEGKEQPPRSWAGWFSDIHAAATTTWLGAFLVLFVGVPVFVAAWYVFFWVFSGPTFLAVVVGIWLGCASAAYWVYAVWCLTAKAVG